jgi:hypothetical protein
VTYTDLLNSQQLFQTTLGSTDPVLTQLIAAKARFLGVNPTASVSPVSPPRAASAAAGPRTDRMELP